MMQLPFLLYPGNAKFLSRQSRHINNGTRTVMVVMLIVMPFIAALTLGFGSWGLADKDARFATKGVTTEGQITSWRYSRGSKSTTYYITYNYKANNQTFRNEESVDSDIYRNAYSGKKISIRYLRDNPVEAELAGHTETFSIVLFAIIGISLLAGAAYIFTRLQRQDRITRTGTLLQGMIEYADYRLERSGRSRQWMLNVAYVFRNPSGIEIRGTDKRARKDLRDINPQTLGGAPLAVLYMDDKNYIVL